MNSALKVLIATACVVVIASGAWFVWGEWQAYKGRAASEEAFKFAEQELYRLADAKPSELDKVRDFCAALQRNPEIVTPPAGSRQTLATCRALGLI